MSLIFIIIFTTKYIIFIQVHYESQLFSNKSDVDLIIKFFLYGSLVHQIFRMFNMQKFYIFHCEYFTITPISKC